MNQRSQSNEKNIGHFGNKLGEKCKFYHFPKNCEFMQSMETTHFRKERVFCLKIIVNFAISLKKASRFGILTQIFYFRSQLRKDKSKILLVDSKMIAFLHS